MNNRFVHFQDLTLGDQATWENKSILSFDMDWATDDVLHYMLRLINKMGKKVVVFVTHKTDLLRDFRANDNIELGIHPNFNRCFEVGGESVENVLEEILNIVPEAQVSRSHSLTTSGRWLGLYKSAGLRYLSNYMMEWQEDINPFRHVNGLIEVPIYFADDGFIFQEDISKETIGRAKYKAEKKNKGLKVFNFHPIHLYLNTPSYRYYDASKKELVINKNGLGVLSLFEDFFLQKVESHDF